MENHRATTATANRPRTDRRTRSRRRRRHRRAPPCRRYRGTNRVTNRTGRRYRYRRVRPRRVPRSRSDWANRPQATEPPSTAAAALGQFGDSELRRLLARVLGASGSAGTLTATSLFWLLLYAGWQAGLGIEAALWLSTGAVVGALATRGSPGRTGTGAESRTGRRRPPRDRPTQSTSR